MDPNACWKRLQAALDNGEPGEVADAARDLHRWVARGGALPSGWEDIWDGADVRSMLATVLRFVRDAADCGTLAVAAVSRQSLEG
jgi:hypothetical protein